jgi:GNAT superfamily N-acetyltransferase
MIDTNIRPFDPQKDWDAARRCFDEGFEHIMWPSIEHARPSLHTDYLKFFYKMSTDFLVAEVDGEIHGFIFGAAPFRAMGLISAIFFYLVHMVPKAFINGYGMNWLAYKHFFRLFYGYAPLVIYHPFQWPMCEVTLFTSRKTHRGQGLGRRLMDAFVDRVRARGHAGTFVSTDTALSYRFYESYGFKLVSDYAQRAYKYSIPDKSFRELIYFLKVRG